MLLRAHRISKRYGKNAALTNVSFEVRPGELLGLIGPNGAGKTTLFECLAGLIAPDSGEVECGGRTIPLRRRKDVLFYLPDAIRPWPDQTVNWVLGFFASLYGGKAQIEELQLDHLLPSRIGTLSNGELKRLLLALGLLAPHPLLLLDEPFDGLDFRQTRDAMAVLRQQKRALFLSIHQLNDAARICDRFVLLSHGEVAGAGTLQELRSQAGLAGGGLEDIFLALT